MFDEMLNMLANDLNQPTQSSSKPYEPLQFPILLQTKVETPKSQPYNPIKLVKNQEKQIQMPIQITKTIQQLARNAPGQINKQQQQGNINIKSKPQLQSQSLVQQKSKVDLQNQSVKNTKIQDPKIIKKQPNTNPTATVKPIVKMQKSTKPSVNVLKEQKQSPTNLSPLPMIEKKKSAIPIPISEAPVSIAKEIVKTPQPKMQPLQPSQPSQRDIEVQKLRQMLLQGQQKQKKHQPKVSEDKKKQQKDLQKKQSTQLNLKLPHTQSKQIKKIEKVITKKKISVDKQEDYDANDSFIDDNEDDLDSTEQREIQQVMKKLREKKKKIIDDDDDDDDIREVGFAQIEKEQQISRYIGYMEDERELKYIKRQEAKEREREREREKEKERRK